ncbi:MAG: FIST C-terminal domain-containing protein [Litoreibacter sp.]|nr:FIST C-terminal domain-containing protein [Litoreibacter sp.]
MKIQSFGLNGSSELDRAIKELAAQEGGCSFLAVHHREGCLDPTALSDVAGAVHCATSCGGIMMQQGVSDIGLFAISDPDGDYGTACVQISDDTYAAARAATQKAISRADREGEAPDLIWISITPGNEEDALKGIEDVVGSDVPIIGGSAADDTVSGRWSVSDTQDTHNAGIVVSALFCSTPLHIAYQSGYEPTPHTGVATKTHGRTLLEIDGKPAAQVYTSWNQGTVPTAKLGEPVNILSQATLWPVGRQTSSLCDVPYFLLAHPCASNPDGSIELFAEINEGERLTQMTGNKDVLAARGGRVAEFALKSGNVPNHQVEGALVVYCGGCMLAVQDQLEDVYSGVNKALDDKPFLGVFTFGEQGRVHGVGNRHGNLMISCVAFSKSE